MFLRTTHGQSEACADFIKNQNRTIPGRDFPHAFKESGLRFFHPLMVRDVSKYFRMENWTNIVGRNSGHVGLQENRTRGGKGIEIVGRMS